VNSERLVSLYREVKKKLSYLILRFPPQCKTQGNAHTTLTITKTVYLGIYSFENKLCLIAIRKGVQQGDKEKLLFWFILTGRPSYYVVFKLS
jgi:hypothetical protein